MRIQGGDGPRLYLALIQDRRLTSLDRLIYGILDFIFEHSEGRTDISTSDFLQHYYPHTSESSLQRSLRKLEKYGLIHRAVKSEIGSGRTRTIYNTYNTDTDTVFNPVVGVVDQEARPRQAGYVVVTQEVWEERVRRDYELYLKEEAEWDEEPPLAQQQKKH